MSRLFVAHCLNSQSQTGLASPTKATRSIIHLRHSAVVEHSGNDVLEPDPVNRYPM